MGDAISILERQIRFAAARHGVLASNVANIDTPGYRAKDLKFEETLGAERMTLVTTSPGHSGGAHLSSRPGTTVEGGTPWGDRNTVELDVEMAKITENALQYQAAVTMLTTNIRMYRQALRRTP